MEESTVPKKQWLGKTPKDKRNNIIVIVLATMLIALIIVFFIQRQEHISIIKEINTEKDSIQVKLNEMVAGYDSLRTENDTLNDQLFYAQTKVKDLLIEINQTKKISFRKISRYQKEVSSLQKIMRNFVVQIDSLNKRNKILMTENLEVKEQYKQVKNKNKQLSHEKKRLQQNLQRAAMLEARGLFAEAINSRSKKTKYVKRAEKIRISFTLSKNVTAKRGPKNIYVRIMRPDQLLLSKSSNNLFRFEDLKIQYSAMREVNYEGKELQVALYWDNSGSPNFMAGKYTVDVFADGNNIGTTTFELK